MMGASFSTKTASIHVDTAWISTQPKIADGQIDRQTDGFSALYNTPGLPSQGFRVRVRKRKTNDQKFM